MDDEEDQEKHDEGRWKKKLGKFVWVKMTLWIDSSGKDWN